jgi:NAD(P)-dependent dehydrogenase (short-subunit alcohol dehydrogenase family)
VSGSLDDRVCIVTGAAGEIGRATALAFAEAGARLSLIDGNGAALESVEDELIGKHGADAAIAITADVADGVAVEAYVAETRQRLGGLDALVNCAGVEGPIVDSHEYDEAEFDRVLDVNVKGTWLSFRHSVPAMLEAGGGSIVNVASGASLRALPGLSAYVASKHAVIGLTRSAAVELATSGIRVNALCPGPVESRMMDSLEQGLTGFTMDEARELYLQRVPMKRYAASDEIAGVARFLASDEASFVTGAVISVDGGASAA